MSEQFNSVGSETARQNIVDIAVAKKSRQATEPLVVDIDSRSYDTAGDLLRVIREARKYSHQDVYEKTNIKISQIIAIETMDLRSLPNPAYALGFIRTYAAFLDLPADEVVRRFRYEADIHPPSIAPKMQTDRVDLEADMGRHFSMLAVIAIISFFLWVGFQVTRPSDGTAVIASSPLPLKRIPAESPVNSQLDGLPAPDRGGDVVHDEVIATPASADIRVDPGVPDGGVAGGTDLPVIDISSEAVGSASNPATGRIAGSIVEGSIIEGSIIEGSILDRAGDGAITAPAGSPRAAGVAAANDFTADRAYADAAPDEVASGQARISDTPGPAAPLPQTFPRTGPRADNVSPDEAVNAQALTPSPADQSLPAAGPTDLLPSDIDGTAGIDRTASGGEAAITGRADINADIGAQAGTAAGEAEASTASFGEAETRDGSIDRTILEGGELPVNLSQGDEPRSGETTPQGAATDPGRSGANELNAQQINDGAVIVDNPPADSQSAATPDSSRNTDIPIEPGSPAETGAATLTP